MPDSAGLENDAEETVQETKKTGFHYLKQWGDSPLPPLSLATLILPLSLRPVQPVALLFPPVLLFTSYVNVSGYESDAAGMSAAWSGLYLLMARRRKYAISQRLGVRGGIRALAMGLAAVNVVGGGVGYAFGRRKGGREGLDG
ncbi:MAG: hypothetical protein M1814_006253 [Vezdaea aestivalis]|nr:MAG: hypothetical protein M1814_006253 [Vezdaea aestivalis]